MLKEWLSKRFSVWKPVKSTRRTLFLKISVPCLWKYPSIVQSSQIRVFQTWPCWLVERLIPNSDIVDIENLFKRHRQWDWRQFLIICWRWRHKIRTLDEGQKQPLSTIHSPRNAFIACAPTFGSTKHLKMAKIPHPPSSFIHHHLQHYTTIPYIPIQNRTASNQPWIHLIPVK